MEGEFDIKSIPPEVLAEIMRRLKEDRVTRAKRPNSNPMEGSKVWYSEPSKAVERERPYLVEKCPPPIPYEQPKLGWGYGHSVS